VSKETGYNTCPFDIMMSNYKGVIECIKDDFAFFCDPNYLELKTMYGTNEKWIYNKKYRFLFNHESPGHANLYISQCWELGSNHFVVNNYEHFITRYQNRINNFKNYLNSGNRITFVLHRYNNNMNDLNELVETIRIKYPNLTFQFKLLQDTNYERIYCHQLMMGINDDDSYSEHNRFNHADRFYYLHKDYNSNIFKNFQEDNLLLNEFELKQKFLVYYLFNKNLESDKIVYSLKTFYDKFNNFDYFAFRSLYRTELHNFTEEETIIHWNNNFNKLLLDDGVELNKLNNNLNVNRLNVYIYPHLPFNMSDGGVTVQYYLAQILDKLGVRVRICDGSNLEKNNIFNNVFCNDFVIDDCIVIYCEGIPGNPLNAKNVVRWMLSPLGKNVPEVWITKWNKNELVYYFNPEPRFEKSKIGTIYKLLTCPYVNPDIVNYNTNVRNGMCFSYRKKHYHKKIDKIHNDGDFEITREHSQEDYIEVFNNHKYFVLYDPLSFLMSISTMCGCVAIIHPVDGLTKLEWLHTTFYSFYLKCKNLDNIYGVAYGIEDIEYAESTIHLAYEQMMDIKQCFVENSIQPFIDDMQFFEKMPNTLENNYDLSKYV